MSNQPIKLQLQGTKIPTLPEDQLNPFLAGEIQPVEVIELGTNRSESTIFNIDCQNDDIINLELEDNAEWIGSAQDFREIYGELQSNRNITEDGVFLVPSNIQSNNASRGWGDVVIKKVKRFVLGQAKIVGRELGKILDEKIMPTQQEGLYLLNSSFGKTPVTEQLQKGHFLLFLHGTVSSTDGSFGKLRDDSNSKVWQTITQKYGKNILCLEHKTVSVSPIQNALDVLQHLPEGSTIDIISHSRGGIVADLLSRCDNRNSVVGFTKAEIELMERSNEEEKGKDDDFDPISADLFKKLTQVAIEKKINIGKIIRVACPARGTILLSKRFDHYLNGLLYAIGRPIGGNANPSYKFLKTFIMEVIKTKTSPSHLAGINAMVPNSTFQKILNNSENRVKNELITIEGNSEFGGNVVHSIAVILTNLFYLRANDFVVNTDSMRYGTAREKGVYVFLSKDSITSHFNYFENTNTQSAVKRAIEWNGKDKPGGFEYYSNQVTRDKVAIDFGEVFIKEVSGKRPIVILLPGIMGSNLEVNNEKIWLDFLKIGKGKLKTELNINNAIVQSNSIIGKYYAKIITELENNGYDVRIFPYDWRKSISQAADKLKQLIDSYKDYKQPIKLLAHSMGGVVVRETMRLHKKFWNSYINKEDSKFVMLGTPWLGSHLIVEVLTGNASTVKKIVALDLLHTKDELLRTFNEYDGVYQLLPIDNTSYENIANQMNPSDSFAFPSKKCLADFSKYKESVHQFCTSSIDFKNIYYIAGYKASTTCGYEIKSSFFSGKYLQFKYTSKGDGSVTYELGIPKNLPKEQLYYTSTEHGLLANDPNMFKGILDLLDKGSTSLFRSSPYGIGTRGIGGISKKSHRVESEHNDDLDTIFGIDSFAETQKTSSPSIEISVTHGHLRVADYPVLVGHFKNDGIVSAEQDLDKALGHKLEERRLLGNYVNDIGDNFTFYDAKGKTKGAIVIGLGDPSNLTGFRLTQSVEKGIIEYALRMRDYSIDNTIDVSRSISSIAIGSGFGKLTLENALFSILNGVNNANEKIKDRPGLQTITKIEFIDLYEDIARNIIYALKRVDGQQTKLNIEIKTKLNVKHGALRRIQYNNDFGWWHQFVTQKKIENNRTTLQFLSSSGAARVEQRNNFLAENIISQLLEDLAQQTSWNPQLAKPLFELLIPNEFKGFIRDQNNILWKLDKYAASFPWEMFHDSDYDIQPTFVKAGLIRQLASLNFDEKPELIRTKTALVIGDPIYKNLPQLPAAMDEAEWVYNHLQDEGYHLVTSRIIRKKGVDNVKAICNNKFKILHIAAHGLFDKKANTSGIAIGDDMLLTPNAINNLLYGRVPEFVFINCCYSGTMDEEFEQYTRHRYHFAANVGTQLIEMGVSAAVVTGWAVNDAAAELFAQVFYEKMTEGYHFGEAVKIARNTCYNRFPKNNTWGAYQCYGDPWYQFDVTKSKTLNEATYITLDEVLCALDNLLVKAKNPNEYNQETLIEELESILNKTKHYDQAQILEKAAQIYTELDLLNEAVDSYAKLLNINKATFSVKCLEQYCNLLSKKIVEDNITDSKEIKVLQDKLDSLLNIGETSERLSIYASAHKRLAQVFIGDKKFKHHLEEMERKYKSAYLKLQDESPKAFTYPLSNYITVYYFLDRTTNIVFERKKESVTSLLTKLVAILKELKLDKNVFWEDIAIVNIKMCQLLFEDKVAEINTLKSSIISSYNIAFEQGGSYKNLRAEIEHINFILAIDKNEITKSLNKKNRAALIFIKKKLGELKAKDS